MASNSATQGNANSMGVLYTGWLNKKNPINGYYKKRFVVLTSEAIHWFKRETRAEKTDLFGEERGQIALAAVLSVRILDEDSNVLAIQASDRKTRFFKGESNTDVEEWVSAIRSAGHATKTKPQTRRMSKNGNYNFYGEDGDIDKMPEVTVQIISVKSGSKQTEYVAARSPSWDRVVSIKDFRKDDEVIISTSNGGLIVLNYVFLELRSDQRLSEVDVPVLGVPLPQSLRMTVSKEEDDNDNNSSNGHSSSNNNGNGAKKKQKPSFGGSLGDLFLRVTGNRTASAIVMLSLMVLAVGANSIAALTYENLLLCALSICLALFSMSIVLQSQSSAQSPANGASKGYTYNIKIRSHQYTSPDAPVHELDEEIPQRFINGCEGDLKEARRRWDITRHWRETEGVNNVLQEPQPYFFIIRNHYPFYHAGRDKQGQLVFYERPGDFEQQQLKARGVTLDHLWRHWLFVTEYQWEVIVKEISPDDMGKSVSVIDIEHVSMSDLTGEKLDHLKRSVGAANAHYPERSFVIFVVNAPVWFSFIWKLIKPLIHENTQKKVKILSKRETLAGLQEHIDISQIPSYYGGQLDFGGPDSCRFKSDDVVRLETYVRELNAKFYGDDDKAAAAAEGGGAEGAAGVASSSSPLPPGQRGVLESGDNGPIPSAAQSSASIAPSSKNRDDDVWSVCSAKTASTLTSPPPRQSLN